MRTLASILAALVVSILIAVTARAHAGPPRAFPRLDHGACPGECCQYGRWTAGRLTVARVQPDRRSAEAFRVAPGEVVEAITGIVITLRPGRARAIAPVEIDGVPIPAGTEVVVLSHAGEGVYKIWFAGRMLMATLLPADAAQLTLLIEPRIVWWVQIRNRDGRTGWIDQADRFDGADACA